MCHAALQCDEHAVLALVATNIYGSLYRERLKVRETIEQTDADAAMFRLNVSSHPNWPTTASSAPPRTSSRSSAPALPSRRTWPLPVDRLKIETTFVRELGTNVGDLAIVSCDHRTC